MLVSLFRFRIVYLNIENYGGKLNITKKNIEF
jgi:hypothetical protein